MKTTIRNIHPATLLVFLSFGIIGSVHAADVLWSSAAGSAWLTGGNWTGSAVPGTADNGQFGANPTSGATGIGINFPSAGAIQQVGAVEVTSARSSLNLILGNSSGTAGNTGSLQLNGATVNAVANTILRNAGAGSTTLTLRNTQGSGTSTMGVTINNASAIIDATSPIVISSIISGANGFTKSGAGTLTLSGANTYTGPTAASAGTLKLGAAGAIGNGVNNSSGVTIGGSSILDLGGITPTAIVPLFLNSTANGFDVGAFQNSGAAAIYGGTVTLQRQTRIGGAGAITLTNTITGGGFNLIKDSTSTLTLTNSGTVSLGVLQANRGTIQANAGTTLNVTSIDVGTGNSVGSGLTLNGGAVTSTGQSRFGQGAGSASATLTLNSGTLTVPALTKGSLTFNANFNGGTLKAGGNSATFFSAATLARVQAGGAVIDDGGFAITIAQPLTDTVATGGGLTKQGAGTLTLSGANNYVGATTISGGTLKAGATSALGFGGFHTTAISSVGGTIVNNGFTLDLNGLTINEPLTLNGTGVGGNGAVINSSASPAIIGSGIAGISVSAIGTVGPLAAISFSGTGSGATAVAVGSLTAASFTINSGTTTYSTAPSVTISGGGGSGATATATLSGGLVTSITITAAGAGYTSAPSIAFSGGTVLVAGTNPTGTGNANNFTPLGVQTTAVGSGYTGATTYSFTGGNGTWTPGTVALSSVVLASDSSIGGSGDMTINAAISQSGGTRSLTKVGAGTLTLNGLNTYGGTTTVSAGRLAVSSAQTTTGNLTVSDSATLRVTVSGASQLQPAALSLGTSTGAALELNGINSTATAPINAGSITSGGTLAVTVSSGTFAVGQTYPLITWSSGSAPTATLSSMIALGVTAHLTNTANSLSLVVDSVSDIWTGVVNGNWDSTTTNWSGYAASFTDGDSVVFDDSVTGTTNVTIAQLVQPSGITVNNSTKIYTITSSAGNYIGGGQGLTKLGGGTLNLAGGFNTNSGATTISGGTVSVSALANGGSASDIGSSSSSATNLTLNSATLQYAGAGSTSDRLFTIGTSGATLDASGSGALNLNNSGSVVLSGSGARTVALTGTSTSANTLTPSLSDNGGATAVSKSGAGSWTLAGANTYSGATDLSGGTLALSGSGTLGNGSSALTVSGGTLDLGGLSSPAVGPVSITGASTIQNGSLTGVSYSDSHASGTATVSAALLANGGAVLTKTGAGTLTLSGANSFTGGVNSSAGGINLLGDQSAATGGYFIGTNNAASTTLNIGNSGQSVATRVLVAAGNAIQVGGIGGTGFEVLSAVGAGSFPTTVTNHGTLLGGRNSQINIGNNVTWIQNSNLTVQAIGGFGANFNINSGGVLAYNGSSAISLVPGGANAAGSAFFTVAGGSFVTGQGFTYNTGVNGSFSRVTLNGGGKLTLTADIASLASGDSTGQFQLGNGGGVIDTVGFNTTLGTAVTDVTSQTGSLTKLGVGTLTLTQPNTYSGTTTVSNGTLVVNGSLAGGAVTVASGAVLEGTGTIGGTVTNNGAIAPGTSVGTLTLSSPPELAAGSLVMEINRNGGSPLSDKIDATAGVTLAGALTVTNVGAAAQNGDTFDLFDGAVTGGFGSVTVPSEGLNHWKTNNLVVDGTITFSNAAPIVADQTVGVVHGETVTLPVIGAKNGATDPDGDVIAVTAISTPGSGSASFGPSNITYVASGSLGTNTFSYTVTDALGASDTKTVIVIVSDPQGFNQVSAGVDFGNAILTYLGIPGTNYALEITHDLPATNWVPVITNSAAANGYLNFTNPISLSPMNDYYRTRYVP